MDHRIAGWVAQKPRPRVRECSASVEAVERVPFCLFVRLAIFDALQRRFDGADRSLEPGREGWLDRGGGQRAQRLHASQACAPTQLPHGVALAGFPVALAVEVGFCVRQNGVRGGRGRRATLRRTALARGREGGRRTRWHRSQLRLVARRRATLDISEAVANFT